MNKKAGFTDLFLFIIFSFIIAIIVGVFIYIGNITTNELHEHMDDMSIGGDNINVTDTIDNTMGRVNESYNALKWLSIMIFFGMIIGIFIGSYLITTKPVFFIPYFFIMIIAIIISVGIANAYETLIATPILQSTYAGMSGINWFILYLPIEVTVLGFLGAIIMFSRLGKREEVLYYG